jgi:hypothetical protein
VSKWLFKKSKEQKERKLREIAGKSSKGVRILKVS